MKFLVLLASLSLGQDIVPKDAKLEKLWSEGDFTEGPAPRAPTAASTSPTSAIAS